MDVLLEARLIKIADCLRGESWDACRTPQGQALYLGSNLFGHTIGHILLRQCCCVVIYSW